MGINRRYYFLQMPENFFRSKRIKRLRSLAGGDTFTIIYLKMQLKAMNNKGVLEYCDLLDDIASEIALDIDEEPDNVRVTMTYLEKCGLLEIRNNGDCYLPYAEINVGTISQEGLRKRDQRERKKLQEGDNVPLLSQECPVDIDIDKDIDIEKDINISSNKLLDCPTKSDEKYVFPDETKKWNELETLGITTIRGITPDSTRAKLLKARLKQYGKESFDEVIKQIRASDFLQGKHNGRPWQITFDWLVKPNNYPKVLEGNYKNTGTHTGSAFDNITL
jgi:predicted phage replisome organizer